jgi:ADP-ribose pyrophosphatase
MIKKWKKVKTEETYHCGKWYKVDKDKIITPGGKEGTYYIIKKTPSVIIIPTDKKGNVYLTRQHRYPIDEYSLEFPAGHSDGEKKSLQCAKKELGEEMELISKKWQYLGYFYESLGMSNIKIFVYIAKEVMKKENGIKDPLDKNLHETYITNTKKLKELVRKNEIKDGLTMTAFIMALEKKAL